MLNKILSIGIAAICVYLGTGVLIERVESATQAAPPVKQAQAKTVQKAVKPQARATAVQQDRVKQPKAKTAVNSSQQRPKSRSLDVRTASAKPAHPKKAQKTVVAAASPEFTQSPDNPEPVDEQANPWKQDMLDGAESILDDIGKYTNK